MSDRDQFDAMIATLPPLPCVGCDHGWALTDGIHTWDGFWCVCTASRDTRDPLPIFGGPERAP